MFNEALHLQTKKKKQFLVSWVFFADDNVVVAMATFFFYRLTMRSITVRCLYQAGNTSAFFVYVFFVFFELLFFFASFVLAYHFSKSGR